MKTSTLRLGLSLMVVVGFWTNPLPAQVLVVPTVPYEPAPRPYYDMPLVPRQLPATPNDLVHRSMYNHGVGCGPDGYYNTCPGWRYEAHFIFGSCSWFFGQPCTPGQPCFDRYRQR